MMSSINKLALKFLISRLSIDCDNINKRLICDVFSKLAMNERQGSYIKVKSMVVVYIVLTTNY